MAAYTRDEVIKRVARGDKFDRADLKGLDLSKAKLAKAAFERADLDGANLEAADLSAASMRRATLRESYLVGANLSGANLENADLEGAKLERANLSGANLTRANLEGAVLTGANLSGAQLSYAQLAGARLTGAKAAGLVGTGTPVGVVDVGWLDLSPAGDGSQRVENGVIPTLLVAGAASLAKPVTAADGRRRYFGRGDVLRGAQLQFDAGAQIEIDSLFQDCTICIGDDTELVIGPSGVLADCEIIGGGNVTIHGKFFERKSPGMVALRKLDVSAKGAIVATVTQHAERTKFAFESGCQLRVKIVPSGTTEKAEAKR